MINKRFVFLFIFCSILAENSGADLPKSADESGVDHGVRWTAYVLQKGDSPKNLFGDFSTEVIRFNKMAKKYWKPGVIIKKPADEDLPLLKNWTPMPKEYEICSPKGVCLSKAKKGIVIDLKEQFLGVYENGKLTHSFPVSTGTSALECKDFKTKQPKSCETPAGFYQIKNKYKKAFSYRYKVWMYYPLDLGHERYIHATDPPDNIPGYPASHGCVRMFTKNARAIFKMIPVGAPAFIVPSVGK